MKYNEDCFFSPGYGAMAEVPTIVKYVKEALDLT
jgi:hypothetical protein